MGTFRIIADVDRRNGDSPVRHRVSQDALRQYRAAEHVGEQGEDDPVHPADLFCHTFLKNPCRRRMLRTVSDRTAPLSIQERILSGFNSTLAGFLSGS